ncbi:MAG: methyltransferase [Rhodococcus sp.]|nr:methyltransferase [Rhodococcus sp. (in: high G+C Gram-positive bacteria)]
MPDPEDLFATLRRFPDVEAPNLFAVDAADRLILDEAANDLAAVPDGTVVVIGDHYGALTLGAATTHGLSGIRVHQDGLPGEKALAANAERSGLTDRFTSLALEPELVEGARVVLMQLPRSLAELGEQAEIIARHAHPDVVVFAGGRIKHMTTAMNEVFGTTFSDVRAGLGRQKSRVLTVRGPQGDGEQSFPVRVTLEHPPIDVVAYGAVFGGPKLDIGTRFLLDFLSQVDKAARTAVDLGCGTGILAVELARANPNLTVVATDQSAAAVASAAATAVANGVGDRVHALRDDAMSTIDDASHDVIVCNPPFHIGAAVHTGAARKMFAAAGRVLRPGGEMWTVYNTHLGYCGMLTELVGETEVVGRNAKFTVTVSRR